jgi:hypothetical protein
LDFGGCFYLDEMEKNRPGDFAAAFLAMIELTAAECLTIKLYQKSGSCVSNKCTIG